LFQSAEVSGSSSAASEDDGDEDLVEGASTPSRLGAFFGRLDSRWLSEAVEDDDEGDMGIDSSAFSSP